MQFCAIVRWLLVIPAFSVGGGLGAFIPMLASTKWMFTENGVSEVFVLSQILFSCFGFVLFPTFMAPTHKKLVAIFSAIWTNGMCLWVWSTNPLAREIWQSCGLTVIPLLGYPMGTLAACLLVVRIYEKSGKA
jgi:hypothetical protein